MDYYYFIYMGNFYAYQVGDQSTIQKRRRRTGSK
jgi:hypothetical protein